MLIKPGWSNQPPPMINAIGPGLIQLKPKLGFWQKSELWDWHLPNTSAMQSPLVMYSINALVSRDQINFGLWNIRSLSQVEKIQFCWLNLKKGLFACLWRFTQFWLELAGWMRWNCHLLNCLNAYLVLFDQPEEWLVLVLLVELLGKLSGESQTLLVNQSEPSR